MLCLFNVTYIREKLKINVVAGCAKGSTHKVFLYEPGHGIAVVWPDNNICGLFYLRECVVNGYCHVGSFEHRKVVEIVAKHYKPFSPCFLFLD